VQSSVTFKLDSTDALNNLELEAFSISAAPATQPEPHRRNVGNNILDGVLNTGSDASLGDTLEGGAGDDTYIVHNVADLTIEAVAPATTPSAPPGAGYSTPISRTCC
jgi:hypothetical protein